MKEESKILEVYLPTERAFDDDLANKTKWEALRFIARIIHQEKSYSL